MDLIPVRFSILFSSDHFQINVLQKDETKRNERNESLTSDLYQFYHIFRTSTELEDSDDAFVEGYHRHMVLNTFFYVSGNQPSSINNSYLEH